MFTGHITTGRGSSYWIESADKYFPESDPRKSENVHSIIYSENDMDPDPYRSVVIVPAK